MQKDMQAISHTNVHSHNHNIYLLAIAAVTTVMKHGVIRAQQMN